ncbi:LOW QUALITY PROTEIN: F-box and leucine-rich protein 22 [Syngnathus acus]|uniref:LOW QUALITY PROTEIN: F-box and leucine-rich protein 22 n=1 Tax=Syngnathus acus TaxID=161584 RepID=UPI0018864D57|nr:LOW QUALITY PROTEIN: F-box and leucine-rich protein 22 [Syngnathus acus]
MYLGHTIRAEPRGSLLLPTIRPLRAQGTSQAPAGSGNGHAMELIQLNRECLLHIFSFLDKDSRRSLSLTCAQLRDVFLDPLLWKVLHFDSLSQLRCDNFVLGAFLRHLSICWYSSRVLKVCNIEDWLKSSFQRDICRKHDRLVSTFLARVGHMCPHLLSLKLSGCAHIADQDVMVVLQRCGKLRHLHLENCVGITDRILDGAAAHGVSLEEVRVDFCRNITKEGLKVMREKRPELRLSAERSAGMIPDSKPEENVPLRRTLQKLLEIS